MEKLTVLLLFIGINLKIVSQLFSCQWVCECLALRWITDNNDRHQEGSDGVWWNLNLHMDEWSCSDLHLETKCISSSLWYCPVWTGLCCSWNTQTQFSCTSLLKIILPSDSKSRSVFCSTDLSSHVVELTAPLFQFSQSSHNIVSTNRNQTAFRDKPVWTQGMSGRTQRAI